MQRSFVYDHYYRYQAITDILKGYAEKYPALTRLSSIGQTPQGRSIWLLEVTDTAAGAFAVSYTHLDVYKRQELHFIAIGLSILMHEGHQSSARNAAVAIEIDEHFAFCLQYFFFKVLFVQLNHWNILLRCVSETGSQWSFQ